MADRPGRILRQRIVRFRSQIILPAAWILLHHQPAADIKHQTSGNENDASFQHIAVLAGIPDREQPRCDEAEDNRHKRAAIERGDTMPATDLAQIARQRRNHEHGFEPLAKQNDSGLDKCVRHDETR